ncbi:acyl-CoA dehydrogenase family protein [Acidianus sp. HS-5]|uniref:acyl-CoA dehydrogenase family protein n=1 Tax=Acidianus sp. HS-5 TaxID=2886040 RepID=UPI001F37CA06|nr:acyl-CoA dehydrogenase family protein [Acidianus sp. HS-5]BDC18813.1 acyl-CoA dehydrogenase [Acidianus sp. HS-5]
MFPFESVQDFEIKISEEHELFRRSVREFSEEILAKHVMQIEKTNSIPDEAIVKAKELGLFGIGIPPEYGGQGGDSLMLAIANEEIARVYPAFAALIGANYLFTIPLLIFGTEEQKRKYVTPVAKGEVFAAHANTEPGAGSDIAGIKTTARKEGNKYIINGRKYFITGADRAKYLVVSARTNLPSKERWKGITFFILDTEMPGVKIGSKINVIGLRGEQPNEVILDNVEVPEENILGKVDEGFKVAVTTYDRGRVGVAAQAVGIAQGAFEKAFNYSLFRKTFDKPLISYEGIAFKLADMLAELEAARLLTYWAANMNDKNEKEAVMASSLAKLMATEVAEKVSSLSIKIHGGAGVDQQNGVERYLRDAIITTIYEGANDIQRLTIIRDLVRKIVGTNIEIM